MENYFLLRSNKKSGPFSLQQIVSMGFKPYDLVWVDGKSAAWRYPSEVNELKDYAPATEEQPYDRFYKKDKDNKEETPVVQKPDLPKNIPGSKVFVSMPASPVKNLQPARQEFHSSTPVDRPFTKVNNPEESALPVVDEPKKQEKDTEIKTKYHQSLDEIKEQYVETYLKRKKSKGKIKNLDNITKIAAGIISVFVLGTLAYVAFMPSGSNTTGDSQRKNVTVITPQPIRPEIIPNEKYSLTTKKTNQLANKKPTANEKTARAPVQTEQTKPIKNDADMKNETVQASEKNKINTAETNETGVRNSTSRNESVVTKVKPKSLAKMVSVKANDYRRRAFGGIQNLELTVLNKSSFMLDKVVVVLEYLKPSEEVLKAEQIHFNSVSPNGSMTIKIPDSPRGIKINCKVYSVESAAYEKSMAGL